MDQDAALRRHLALLLNRSEAHSEFEEVIRNFPEELRSKRPEGSPHTPWQLLEHMRLAQWDILEFSRNPHHESPEFPDGYWPAAPEHPDHGTWDMTVRSFLADRRALSKLVSDSSTDLTAPIPHGTGQTILREALLAADHNAYHLGQLLLLRRIMGAWPPA
jgi:hypothetical protein